jgi:hypothetical protein
MITHSYKMTTRRRRRRRRKKKRNYRERVQKEYLESVICILYPRKFTNRLCIIIIIIIRSKLRMIFIREDSQ